MRAEIIVRVAVSKNGYIGNSDNPPRYLPWQRLEGDLPRFKSDTEGYPIIMGKTTAVNLKKPLSGRTNIVLSRTGKNIPEDFLHFPELSQAIKAMENTTDKIFIIGGAQIIEEAFKSRCVDKLVITETYDDFPGDVKLPIDNYRKWKEVKREKFPEFRYDIVTYKPA